jgi:hypothetical protein
MNYQLALFIRWRISGSSFLGVIVTTWITPVKIISPQSHRGHREERRKALRALGVSVVRFFMVRGVPSHMGDSFGDLWLVIGY